LFAHPFALLVCTVGEEYLRLYLAHLKGEVCTGEQGRRASNHLCCFWVNTIEESRAASKSPHLKIGYFHSLSQQAFSSDIIPNSAVGTFSHFLVLNILACLQSSFLNATLCSFFFLMYFPFLTVHACTW
jgi:hypothetical protein